MKKLKMLFYAGLCVVLAMNTIACDESQITPEDPINNTIEEECIIYLLGDKDGFGMGLHESQPFELDGGVALPIDKRDSGDPSFTDIYPADMGSGMNNQHQMKYVYEFESPGIHIKSAKLKLLTLGIQDGDSQVSGSATDIKLYIDNAEVEGAFDEVDQFDYINNHWSDFASEIEVEIPTELLSLLEDGKAEIRWEIIQENQSSQSFDAFAIDYSELEICFSESPAQ